jgi:hypothetical protein
VNACILTDLLQLPHLHSLDTTEVFNWDDFTKLSNLGSLNIQIRYGGQVHLGIS